MNEKIKKNLLDILNSIWSISISISLIAMIVFAFWKINIITKQVLWYASCAIWISSCFNNKYKIATSINKKYANLENAAFVIAMLLIFGGIFIIKTYETSFTWYWYAFVLVAVLAFYATIALAIISWEKSDKGDSAKKKIVILSAKAISYLWLTDLFYMSFIVNSLLLRLIIGIIILTIILASLAVAFLSNSQSPKWLLIIDFLYGIGLTIYLIYIIPEKYTNLQTIVTAIIAAVYSGLLTLVGVAWTIRKGDKDRKDDLERRDKERREDLERIDRERREDLERIDKERTEEERKKYKPFFIAGEYCNDKNIKIIVKSDFIENESFSFVFNEKCTKPYVMKQWSINNTNLNSFAIYGLKFNNVLVNIRPYKFVSQKENINIDMLTFFTREEINSISIMVIDMLDNVYEVGLGFYLNEQDETTVLRIYGNTRPKLTDIKLEP